VTTQPPVSLEVALEERMPELESLGPQAAPPGDLLDMGADLGGTDQQGAGVSLQRAIESAVRHNLSIQIAELQPAINETDVVAAEAAFDAVFFSNFDFVRTDQPQTFPVVGGVPVGTPFNASEQTRFETGFRRTGISGGTVEVSTDLTRYRNNSPGLELSPDPAYTAALRFGLSQPLLRGFGSDVNLATVRFSRNAERRSVQELRANLEGLVNQVEAAYWELAVARERLVIEEWLTRVGIQVRDVLERRREFDTRPSEYADAVARVEERKSRIIEARRAIRGASDRLKVLINDPQLTIGSEVVLVPMDVMLEEPIQYDLRDAVITALENRPEIQIALLGIDDSAIAEGVARNLRLPVLDLTAQIAYFGLEDDAGNAYENAFDDDFIDYALGMRFETPIGNRAGEAGVRRSRLERSQATIAYRREVQNVILDVKETLRDVITAYELIEARRSARIAAAENLRALLVEEETIGGLTPEFLNLKFNRQEALAENRLREVTALAAYSTANASLFRSMGRALEMNRIQLEVEE
jgi:outer membrane protein TolC